MDYFAICLTALVVSALTLFSGFGLGTILMPAFALFFPLPVAIAATAIVHLLNNIFKLGLVGRHADKKLVIKFAVPAGFAAILGAGLLNLLGQSGVLFSYTVFGSKHEITVIKFIIGLVIVGFALLEFFPGFEKRGFNQKYISIGGLLSGFFGGLSGNQGALRSAFLIRTDLSKEAFIGTNTIAAVMVDTTRLLIYGLTFYTTPWMIISPSLWGLVIAATLSAFAGAYIGKKIMKKVTIKFLQIIVAIMLILVGIGMATGFL